MNRVILFRPDQYTRDEFQTCQKVFGDQVETSRVKCEDSLVVCRYSALPFYRELEEDLSHRGSVLANSYHQHNWIADFQYYDVMRDYTPETWFDYDFHRAPEGAYVVKGKTNSRKHQWKRLMFAPTKRDASRIACELIDDGLIGPQGIIYRKYVPLRTFEVGINDLPFTNEWRFFFYGDLLVTYGYYWSLAEEADKRQIASEGVEFARKLANIARDYTNFFVLDIAETTDGEWILIEINDGQMSGLSCIDPEVFYEKLKWAIS